MSGVAGVALLLVAGFGPVPAAVALGLLAVSLGMGRNAVNDHDLLERMFPVYDALYAWARDASGERHAWRPAAM